MGPYLIAAAGSICGLLGLGIYEAIKKPKQPCCSACGTVPDKDLVGMRGADEPLTDFVKVTLPNGDEWEVAPEYIGPVGIGEAADIAKSKGLTLPNAELVDAIFNAADLKIEPPVRSHDGTPRTMSSPATYEAQRLRIEGLVNGRKYRLLAGTHKDVVLLPNGKPGLYGWNVEDGTGFTKRAGIPTHAVRGASGAPVKAGRVIQQEFGGHGLDWKDYSQGLRLVRPVRKVS